MNTLKILTLILGVVYGIFFPVAMLAFPRLFIEDPNTQKGNMTARIMNGSAPLGTLVLIQIFAFTERNVDFFFACTIYALFVYSLGWATRFRFQALRFLAFLMPLPIAFTLTSHIDIAIFIGLSVFNSLLLLKATTNKRPWIAIVFVCFYVFAAIYHLKHPGVFGFYMEVPLWLMVSLWVGSILNASDAPLAKEGVQAEAC